jgi:hypothetical protein
MKIKTINLIIFLILALACSKEKNVIVQVQSLDEINGTWKWESTCGGFTGACGYSSKSQYGEISFSKDGHLIQKFQDSIHMTANYTIVKDSETNGTLMLDNIISGDIRVTHSECYISLANNMLYIDQGSFTESYSRIK